MIYAAIDLGATNIKAGLIGEDLKLICKSSRPTNSGRDAREIIRDMAEMIIELTSNQKMDPSSLHGVGIGIPGVAKDGVILKLENVHLSQVPLTKMFQEFLEVPVCIGNDAAVAAMYEYHVGVLAGCNIGVLLTIGSGIGGGIIIDGRPYSGAHGFGTELGHVPIVPNGLTCNCGNQGCYEVYASASALTRYGRECVLMRPESMLHYITNGDHTLVTPKMIFDCAQDGDYIALSIIDTYVDYLSMGIISIMNSFDPDVIALGGGVSGAGDFLLNKVIAACTDKGVFKGQKYADIRIAKSGNDAGLIGAAMLTK